MINVLKLQRINSDDKSTCGVLTLNGEFQCFTVEDTVRPEGVKIDGETAIPKGIYRVKFREVLSGMTKQYRKYDYFSWHLELQDVPNFKYIYIHIGNIAANSEGCILVGESLSKTDNGWFTGNSGNTFKVLYPKLRKILEDGEELIIEII